VCRHNRIVGFSVLRRDDNYDAMWYELIINKGDNDVADSNDSSSGYMGSYTYKYIVLII
jgi:hypothetical protein